MELYLNTTLAKLKSTNYGELNLILGNESCDLDSAVSALVYSIFLHWQYEQIKCKVCTNTKDTNSRFDDLFLPVLNVDRSDYLLKTEVVYLLAQHGFHKDHLVFRDDLDLPQLVATKTMKVVLVDHHTLATKDKFLAPYVTEIIDHRPLDKSAWDFKADTRTTIETVGSCCTLVAQRIKDLSALVASDVDFFNAYPACGDMLYSTIILDTVNFSKEFNKATPHDEEIILFLESLLKPNDYEAERRNKLDRLTRAKSDVTALSAAQLLKKDVKVFGTVLVPSFPLLVLEFLKKPNCHDAVKEALLERGCTVALLLGMDYTQGMKRDLAVYSQQADSAQKLVSLLQAWTSPSLQLSSTEPPTGMPCHYFNQLNVTATRKQCIPIINEFLKNNE